MSKLIETLRSRFQKTATPDPDYRDSDYHGSLEYSLKKIAALFQPAIYQTMVNEKINREGGFRVVSTVNENQPDILISLAEEGLRLHTFTLTANLEAIKQDLNNQIFEQKLRRHSTIQTRLAVFGENGKALSILAGANSETNTTALVASPPIITRVD